MLKRILSVLLIAGMLSVGMPLDSYALESANAYEYYDDADGNTESDGNVEIDGNAEIDANAEITDGGDSTGIATDTEEIEVIDSTDVTLSEAQFEDKEALSADVAEVSSATAGEDYADNQIIMLADSKEEAIEYGRAYEESTGHRFELISFSHGVATFEISEYETDYETECDGAENTENDDTTRDIGNTANNKNSQIKEQFEDALGGGDAVEAAVILAADTDNDLPAVAPNYYLNLDSPTDNEPFADAFLKKTTLAGGVETDVAEYQFYHEVIGSKYLFDEMDELSADKEHYDGPLNRDFLDNLNEVVVEVIDTGINASHEDFVQSSLYGGGSVIYHPENFATEDPSAYDDKNGHGTNVAGIIGNAVNDKGGRGIAGGVKLKPANVYNSEGKVKTDSVLSAINAATERKSAYERGVRDEIGYTSENICVITMSLGTASYNSLFQKAINEAYANGIVVVASAGNDGNPVLNYPASYDNVLSVASVNAKGVRSQFSNFGHTVDVAAPGGDYARIINGEAVPAQEIYASGIGSDTSYISKRGTSQAAPMAAALAALIKANNIDVTPEQTEGIIKGSARQLDPYDNVGAGVINVASALGLDTGAGSVTSSQPGGYVEDGCEVHLSCDFDDKCGTSYEGMIYYTLDGTVPDYINNSASTKIYDVKGDTPITLTRGENQKSVTLMARPLLFGVWGDVTSFTYSFVEKKIEINSSTGRNDLSVGKSMKLIATDSESGESVPVYWHSSDTSVVTVDVKGNAKAVANSIVPITITASSKDGKYTDATYEIDISTNALKVELEPLEETIEGGDTLIGLYDKNTILMYSNKLKDGKVIRYDIGAGKPYEEGVLTTEKKYHVFPERASQDVIFSSSDSKVATVSKDGIVTPLKSGFSTITIMASDGSGVKDSFRVKCECGITSIAISSQSGNCYVASGQRFTPSVTFNEGKSIPDNKALKWKFTEESIMHGIKYYASINEKTGVVSVFSDCDVSMTGENAPQIVAYSEAYNVTSNPLSVEIFQKTKKAMLSDDLTNDDNYMCNVYYMRKGDSVEVDDDFVEFEPYYCMPNWDYAKGVIVKSSNPKVVSVISPYAGHEKYDITAVAPGTATVTVTANDASKVSKSFKVTVINSIDIKISGRNVLNSGNSITYTAGINGTTSIPAGLGVNWDVVVKWTKIDGEEATLSTTGINNRFNVVMKGNKCTITQKTKKNNGKIEPGENYTLIVFASLINAESGESFKSRPTGKEIKTSSLAQAYGSITESIGVKIAGEPVSEYVFDKLGNNVRIEPYAVPEAAYQEGYIYKSSNEKVAKVISSSSSAAVIEPKGSGTCYITVTAGDNSNKSCKLKVTVATPSVKSISLADVSAARLKSVKLRTELSGGCVDPAGCVYGENEFVTADDFQIKFSDCNRSLESAIEQGLITAWSAASTNTKVIRVEYAPAGGGNPSGYKIIPVAKGSAKVRVSLEGSSRYVDIPVTVVSPLMEVVVDVKSGAVSSAAGSAVMKAGGVVTLRVSAKSGASKTGVKYEYVGSEEEVADMKQYATLTTGGVIIAASASKIGTEARTLKIRAKATDIWGAASDTYTVNILPGVVYISSLKVHAAGDCYNLASGLKVTMAATCNADATKKNITWHIYDEGADDASEGSQYATITSGGVVKAKAGLGEKKTVEVVAVAKEGNPTPCRSERVKVTLYPSVKTLRIVSDGISGDMTGTSAGTKEIHTGDVLDMHVEAESSVGGASSCGEYTVTYTTGAAKVYLEKNPETHKYDGSCFSVYGLSKGSVRITVKALDGSGKSAGFVVKVK